ncbi:hypothetical protein [Agromyces albus]|uniref:hypothetical protein n=1 Tax=Agromyces albus TaxID=205332 RepID=UPI002784B043|nr:hypothetical protein [Agromyces albus]MDQ0576727.1 hypothetical protein [Agromyces albus]
MGKIDPLAVVTAAQPNSRLAELIKLFPVADPPAMVRLEPDSITGDPAPGTEARLGDPAWMLGRQWQFGELTGEDAGTVVSVHVASRSLPVTAWAPLDDATGEPGAPLGEMAWRPWRPGAILEELVQDVPALGFGRGLRQRAEAGAQLVDLLVDAGAPEVAAALVARHPLALEPDPNDPDGTLDTKVGRLFAVLGGALPDGLAIAEELAAGEPDWVSGADDADAVRAAASDWLDWFQGAPDSGGAWSVDRLEYRFALRFGDDDHAIVARGTQFGSAEVRWSDLEWVERAGGQVPDGSADGTPVDTEATMLAAPLRYPAMPADRYWQLEDGAIDLGAIEAQPHDLARICLVEFAMSSGDDWLSVPVDGLLGAVNQITRVELTDDFGDSSELTELVDERFTMFKLASATGRMLPGVVLPPVAAGTLVGDAFEEVLFLRDEMANMAWAIEQTVQGPSGDPRSRASEPPPAPDRWPTGLGPEELVYRLQSRVPAHWIPLVPISTAPGQVSLRKGALLRDGEPVLPTGVTLEPTPLTFPGEEIPREGVHLRAVPVLARRADGRYVRWTAYRVRTGRGEASSRLAWDSALATTQMRHFDR